MRRNAVCVGLSIWIVACGLPSIAAAQGVAGDCAEVSLALLRQMSVVDAVFRGRVTGVMPAPNGLLVTFLVDRVWKGDVQRETTIYQMMAWPMYPPGVFPRSPEPSLLELRPAVGAVPFQTGQEYFISTDNRELMHLRDIAPLKAAAVVRGSAAQCMTMPTSRSAYIEQILDGDPGHTPR